MGGFKTRLNMPGWLLPRPRDHGYGPLALIVAFLIDPNAPVARQGTVGDHPKIPPPYLARPLLRLLHWRNRLFRKA